jgi:hypothetical protein
MVVLERTVKEAAHKVEGEPSTGDAAWFAARQPGIVRYLESRLGRDDGLGVALMAALAVHTAFEKTLGAAPPRVTSQALEDAEREVIREVRGDPDGAGGLACARQPALAEFVASVIDAPPIPLGDEESTNVGVTLLAIVVALDDGASGGAVFA